MNKLSATSVLPAGNVPIIGFGTSQWSNDQGKIIITAALEAGYRHIDTAYFYQNEAIIGETLSEMFKSGKYTREDLFIVTKLPPVGNRPEYVEQFLRKSLANLRLDFVDLYLIHFPVGFQYSEVDMVPADSSGNTKIDMDTDLVALWKAMENQVDAGRTLTIGLSNFNINQIERILKEARIPPVNLQIELNLYIQQRALSKFCKSNNISITAYSPLGTPDHRKSFKSSTGAVLELECLLTHPLVVKIAENHKKTPAQILLRFLLELGVAVIPRSGNPDRIRANIDLFDFELSEDDMEQLRDLDRGNDGRMFGSNMIKGLDTHPEYPF